MSRPRNAGASFRGRPFGVVVCAPSHCCGFVSLAAFLAPFLIASCALASSGTNGAPAAPSAPISDVIRCRGYCVMLPERPSVPVRLHTPLLDRPGNLRTATTGEPDGRAGSFGSARRVYEGAGAFPAPPVVVSRPSAAAKENRGEDRGFLSGALPDGETPADDAPAEEPSLPGSGWLAQDVAVLERTARREGRLRRAAEDDWHGAADSLLPGESADPLGLGKGLYDSEKEENLFSTPGRHGPAAPRWSQPEEQKPAAPFDWSAAGN